MHQALLRFSYRRKHLLKGDTLFNPVERLLHCQGIFLCHIPLLFSYPMILLLVHEVIAELRNLLVYKLIYRPTFNFFVSPPKIIF